MKKINLHKKKICGKLKELYEKSEDMCEKIKELFIKSDVLTFLAALLIALIILGIIVVFIILVIKNMPYETIINNTAESAEVTAGTESTIFDYDAVIKILLLNILVSIYVRLTFGGGWR